MPIDRCRECRSEIIRLNEQVNPGLKEDIAVLHLTGLSKLTLAKLSRESVSNSLVLVKPKALKSLERDLSDRKF